MTIANGDPLRAPFQYFGGKRDVADEVWRRFGRVKQYGEPFCGSMAVLWASPGAASLEVVGDMNGFIANFWRAVANQPEQVARWADYPVSHIDQGARHVWLMQQRERLGAELQDPNWPGDAKVSGWWLWGQCSWIGSGWCEWEGKVPGGDRSSAGQGIQAAGQIPHVSSAGQGIQAAGQIPHVSDAGRGVQAYGKIPHVSDADTATPEYWTSAGRVAHSWLRRCADRLERVRVIHGDWTRCLNHHYGGSDTAYFFDPPYDHYEGLYRAGPVAQAVARWCMENADLRIALCGHRGDYEMSGWTPFEWSRKRNTYGGTGTKDAEIIWFSPACIQIEAAVERRQMAMF
jgi:DNA adenine methylase